MDPRSLRLESVQSRHIEKGKEGVRNDGEKAKEGVSNDERERERWSEGWRGLKGRGEGEGRGFELPALRGVGRRLRRR